MIRRDDFINKYPTLEEGTEVFTKDGVDLGKVVDLNNDFIAIRKGLFFPKDFTFRYDDVQDVYDHKMVLKYNQSELSAWRDEKYRGWDEYDRLNQPEAETKISEEKRMPLREEEIEPAKVIREKGEVRVRKVVHTEMKTFTVPVQKEEVIVERTPVTDTTVPPTDEKAFKEEEIRIPVREEEAEIVKREKVTGEVKVHKETRIEEQKVGGEVRKEEAKVERDRDIDRDIDKDKRKAA